MASKDELLSMIIPNMRLTRVFFLKVYGYELTWPGFAEIALTKLEEQGCSKARTYYADIVAAYEQEHENDMIRLLECSKKLLCLSCPDILHVIPIRDIMATRSGTLSHHQRAR